jgi:hypothetical protein
MSTSKKIKRTSTKLAQKTKVKNTKPQKNQSEKHPIKVNQKNLTDLFNHALNRYKEEMQAEKRVKLKEISHLALIAEEFLSSFALIGYSLQDEKVVIFNTPTAKDEAALVDLLRATFVEIASNRP